MPGVDLVAGFVEYLSVIFVYVVPVAIVVVFAGVGFGLRWAIDRHLTSFASKAEHRFGEIVFHSCRNVVILWSILTGTTIALRTVSFPLPEIVYLNSEKVIVSLLVLSAALCLGRILSGVIQNYGHRVEGLAAMSGVAERIGQLVILAIGIMMALQYLGLDITPLVTTMGIAGLATALALQDTLANFFAGIYVLADRPVKVGDYIKLDSGVEGYVDQVGWRSAKIRTLPNNLVVVPNQKLAQSIITNYFMPEKRMSLLIPISVSYDCDPDRVEKVLVDVATSAVGEVEGLLGDPAPFVRFIPGFGDHSLDFTLICQVREFVDQYLVQHELRKRIFARFRQEGIEIPFPIRTVHLRSDGAVPRSQSLSVQVVGGSEHDIPEGIS